MEWLGVLLLYLVSGFMKKRQQSQNRKKIESDPEWDTDNSEKQLVSDSDVFDNFINDLFETNPKTPSNLSSDIKEVIKEENVDTLLQKNDSKIDLKIDDKKENFEDKVYHSELAERDELHFGNKWNKKTKTNITFLKSKESLRSSIIIKEILEKPLSLRK